MDIHVSPGQQQNAGFELSCQSIQAVGLAPRDQHMAAVQELVENHRGPDLVLGERYGASLERTCPSCRSSRISERNRLSSVRGANEHVYVATLEVWSSGRGGTTGNYDS